MARNIALRFSAGLVVALATLAAVVGTGPSATATQAQAVIAGMYNDATATTTIANTSSGDGLDVYGAGSGIGVYGQGGATGNGVQGYAGNAQADGVFGVNVSGGKGVFGASDATDGIGAYGEANGTSGVGLWGHSDAGTGVIGEGAQIGVKGTAVGPSGFGVVAQQASGKFALEVAGRALFDSAGTAVVASGQKSVTVTLVGVRTKDFVLATVQGSGAFYVKSASAGTGQFTITINKVPTSPTTVTVAYFVISAA